MCRTLSPDQASPYPFYLIRAPSLLALPTYPTAQKERIFPANTLSCSSLVYVEAEATLPTYTVEGQAGPDGTPLKRSSLNLVQRYLQVLKRPYAEQGSTTGAESEADSAAEEPLSGVGQS